MFYGLLKDRLVDPTRLYRCYTILCGAVLYTLVRRYKIAELISTRLYRWHVIPCGVILYASWNVQNRGVDLYAFVVSLDTSSIIKG